MSVQIKNLGNGLPESNFTATLSIRASDGNVRYVDLPGGASEATVASNEEASLVVVNTPDMLYQYDAFATTATSPESIGLNYQVQLTGLTPANWILWSTRIAPESASNPHGRPAASSDSLPRNRIGLRAFLSPNPASRLSGQGVSILSPVRQSAKVGTRTPHRNYSACRPARARTGSRTAREDVEAEAAERVREGAA
jgi:hypothetical protein